MQYWLSTSLKRFYPRSPAMNCPTLALEAARSERLSFQALFRTDGEERTVSATVNAPAGVEVLVRRVGYVPMPHLNTQVPPEEIEGLEYLPGYVPDPLLPETVIHAGPYETHAFWITLRVDTDTSPGPREVHVTLSAEGAEPVTLSATLTVHPGVLPKRRDFPVTHWFYADALMDRYGVEPFEEAFWRILDPYLANVAAHGQDTIYVPVFTPPLDGVKRPTQLLHVRREGDRYVFDWTQVERWIAAAKAQGLSRFEWTHLFTQWGVQHALRIYEGHGRDERLLWPADTGATSDTYRAFLGQFLPALERFLQVNGLQERSFFHVSDEPHGEEHLANYRAARALLRELAPWIRVMDALSDISFARAGLTDTPIPSISTAPEFVREGFPAWAYWCCGPRGRYVNRLLETPLVKVRMSGWLFYRLRARGFLHWGYNYWYKSQTRQMIDPYTVLDGMAWPSWAYGDCFQVYPGEAGPVDSLRWEVFAESLQDYALLQGVGLDPDDALLFDIQDYAAFPREAAWIARRRGELLARLDAAA
ncbi:MAG: DUF4091 domain-containing protein [Armatimonadetes bacterium]|nr:DUF4091 domain-containing protein [Armatimonadota bacterium]